MSWNDDPRLLAYALGEREALSEGDLREIEAALADDESCRAALAELRTFLPEVESALALERGTGSALALDGAARDEIFAVARGGAGPEATSSRAGGGRASGEGSDPVPAAEGARPLAPILRFVEPLAVAASVLGAVGVGIWALRGPGDSVRPASGRGGDVHLASGAPEEDAAIAETNKGVRMEGEVAVLGTSLESESLDFDAARRMQQDRRREEGPREGRPLAAGDDDSGESPATGGLAVDSEESRASRGMRGGAYRGPGDTLAPRAGGGGGGGANRSVVRGGGRPEDARDVAKSGEPLVESAPSGPLTPGPSTPGGKSRGSDTAGSTTATRATTATAGRADGAEPLLRSQRPQAKSRNRAVVDRRAGELVTPPSRDSKSDVRGRRKAPAPDGRARDLGDVDKRALELDEVERDLGRDRAVEVVENPFVDTAADALSTFSIDVDTASYANARRALTSGSFPSPRDVRIEEFVNYFTYDDSPPTAADPHPFSVDVQVGAAPWKPEHRLVRIGLKGRAVELGERPQANLVFLVDVSGSMNRPDKLPLVKDALTILTESLAPEDRVAIVVYASAQGLALRSTSMAGREAVLQALESLGAGGSTNGGAGIRLAYAVAREHFVAGGVNRVILCTDGDFNVGVTKAEDLETLIASEAESGIDLTVLGFGSGNFQDGKMEALSNRGNGNFAFIDTELEARKALVHEVGGTLHTIAKDVKIQVAWNPREVAAFRLLGYENRMLEHVDFADDRKDAGEIGSGHGVTALYEVVPVGIPVPTLADAGRTAGESGAGLDEDADAIAPPAPVRFAAPEPGEAEVADGAPVDETLPDDGLVEVRLRYKRPGEASSVEFRALGRDGGRSFDEAETDLRFAAAVAAFAMRLRGSVHVGDVPYRDVHRWAVEALGRDPGGLRESFVRLVERAIALEPK